MSFLYGVFASFPSHFEKEEQACWQKQEKNQPNHQAPMLARVLSAAVNGIEVFPVEVEVNCGWGHTIIVIVGLTEVVQYRLGGRIRPSAPFLTPFSALAARSVKSEDPGMTPARHRHR
jgi:hypothetical protein